MTRIADLKPFLKNINCKFMVIRLGNIHLRFMIREAHTDASGGC